MDLTGTLRRCRAALVALALVVLPATLATSTACADEPPAQGQPVTCPKCKGALPGDGWCGACKVGVARGVETGCRSCLAAIQGDGWCDGCKVGYVDARKTTCKGCFDLMRSAQGGWCDGCKVGHARGLKTTCRSCLTAIQGDGWCDGCKVGYVGAQKTTCRGCFDLMRSAQGGWCDGCKVGHARGLKTTCRSCLTAIQQGGACEGCGVRFATVAFKRYGMRVADLARPETGDAVAHALSHAGAIALEVDAARGAVRFELDRAREAELTRALAELRSRGVEATLAR